MELRTEEINQIVQLGENAAVEVFAQLTRFVVRGQMTPAEAAVMSWDMAEAFGNERAVRLLRIKETIRLEAGGASL
jgi:hypothetical protein